MGHPCYDVVGFKTLKDGSTKGIGENGCKQSKYTVPYNKSEVNSKKISVGGSYKYGWYWGGSKR